MDHFRGNGHKLCIFSVLKAGKFKICNLNYKKTCKYSHSLQRNYLVKDFYQFLIDVVLGVAMVAS